MSRSKLTVVAFIATFALAGSALAAKTAGKDGVRVPGRARQVLLSVLNPGKTNFKALFGRGDQKTPGFRVASPAPAGEGTLASTISKP